MCWIILPTFRQWRWFTIICFVKANNTSFSNAKKTTIKNNTNYIFTVRNKVAKVMFLQASVCPQRGGGGGVCLSACWDTTPPRSRPPRSRHPLEQTPPPPRADTPQSRHPLGVDTPPQEQTRPRYGHCCGRYASYWNAFLFHNRIMPNVYILDNVKLVNSLKRWFRNATFVITNLHGKYLTLNTPDGGWSPKLGDDICTVLNFHVISVPLPSGVIGNHHSKVIESNQFGQKKQEKWGEIRKKW